MVDKADIAKAKIKEWEITERIILQPWALRQDWEGQKPKQNTERKDSKKDMGWNQRELGEVKYQETGKEEKNR